ncbi:hypothetical protein [Sphingobium jiangsuense]|uniref:hypothetical protein n=1 Tax=Sphingobium jiangsuense TaxID=870476 RepID=UPI00165E66DB|nr:hypothetical protein [Sphingobium jiangsuense]
MQIDEPTIELLPGIKFLGGIRAHAGGHLESDKAEQHREVARIPEYARQLVLGQNALAQWILVLRINAFDARRQRDPHVQFRMVDRRSHIIDIPLHSVARDALRIDRIFLRTPWHGKLVRPHPPAPEAFEQRRIHICHHRARTRLIHIQERHEGAEAPGRLVGSDQALRVFLPIGHDERNDLRVLCALTLLRLFKIGMADEGCFRIL